LDRKVGVLDPVTDHGRRKPPAEELEPLSQIIAELNERFGLNLGPEHRVTLSQLMERLEQDSAFYRDVGVNTRVIVLLSFDRKVEEVIQDRVDTNFELYMRITDDRVFGEVLQNYLFDLHLRSHRTAEGLIKRGRSNTLEFRPSLR